MKAQIAILGWLAAAVAARAETTIDPAHPHAYGANVGWVDARGDATNGAAVGRFYCTGHLYGANVGWIGLGNGPTNGWRYGNAAADDWGVNHDGEGRLSGCAWGANVGWIVFEQTHGQPRVDLRTGNLSGHAWSANAGWIGLSNVQAFVRTASLDSGPDADLDDLPDAYEYRYTNTLAALSGLAGHDADADGATDWMEAGADTDPLDGEDLLRIVSLETGDSTNRVTWTARPTRLYRLETTNDVAAVGPWTDVGPGLLGPPILSWMARDVPDDGRTPGFYRIQAVVPLSE